MDERRIPFTPDDEDKIASVANWGSIIAIGAIASAVISLVNEFAQSTDGDSIVGTLMVAAVLVLLNTWLLQACRAFRKVARTDEADQAHLLVGFRKLRAYFMMQVVLILIGLTLGIIGIALMFMTFG